MTRLILIFLRGSNRFTFVYPKNVRVSWLNVRSTWLSNDDTHNRTKDLRWPTILRWCRHRKTPFLPQVTSGDTVPTLSTSTPKNRKLESVLGSDRNGNWDGKTTRVPTRPDRSSVRNTPSIDSHIDSHYIPYRQPTLIDPTFVWKVVSGYRVTFL